MPLPQSSSRVGKRPNYDTFILLVSLYFCPPTAQRQRDGYQACRWHIQGPASGWLLVNNCGRSITLSGLKLPRETAVIGVRRVMGHRCRGWKAEKYDEEDV